MNRRQALKQTFGFSAAVLASRSSLAAAALPPAVPSGIKSDNYLMIGDWGWDNDLRAQTAVANGMTRYSREKKWTPEALLLLGDSFYGRFKDGTNCPRWKKQFEDMYPKEVFPGPCYTILGNHDYDDEPILKLAAELDYAKAHPGTRWHLPSKWYRFELGPAEKPLVTVLALDSNYKSAKDSCLTPEERAAQLDWCRTELEKPRKTPWLVVMGHHPLYSNGVHGDNPGMIKDFEELFRKHKVHFYFAGHDHDLQHLEFENHPTSFVISGGGGAKLREPDHKRGPFSMGVYGFTHLDVTPERFMVSHIDANGNLLHTFTKSPDGSWKVG